MSFQQLYGSGIRLSSYSGLFEISGTASTTINAAGESISLIGTISLQNGPGSKTISAAGGGNYTF